MRQKKTNNKQCSLKKFKACLYSYADKLWFCKVRTNGFLRGKKNSVSRSK